jgi:hypothetical protein
MQTVNNAKPVTENESVAGAEPRLKYMERRLLEAFDQLWDSFVDPAEATCDVDGTCWSRLGGTAGGSGGMPFDNEQQLSEIRNQCRALAVGNEFAINGHDYPLS